MKRNPFTLDEHRQLGLELARIHDRLQHIGIDLATRYGTSCPIGRAAKLMSEAIDKVRFLLDVGLPSNIYFPSPEQRAEPALVCVADIPESPPCTKLLRSTREVALLDGPNLCRAYRVDLDRVPDAPALLGWIEHLCEKTWLSPQHIRELIQHAERENGIHVDRNA